MQNLKNYSEEQLYSKAKKLVNDIINFSENLPKNHFMDITNRLRFSVDKMPQTLYDGLRKDKKIDHIRAIIEADSCLAECKDQLNIVEMLRYADTKDIMKEIDEFTNILSKTNSIS